MNKKLSRIVSGILSLMFVGQVMIYGDGNSQGIAHAETISDIKESLQFSKNADELQKEFENAVGGLGEIDYFASPESGIMMMNEAGEGKAAKASGLKISGKVEKGGQKTADDTPIFVHIFNGDWAKLASKEISDGDSFSVEASGSDVYHVKFECDGYLPFYLKDFGTGSYTVGSGDSWDTVTLIPGDTTWNEENDNQWSDDVLNAADSEYVKSCLGATRGDSDFNPSMDADGDNVISQDDLEAFCEFYENLGDDEYELPQYIQDLDINLDGVINDYDYKFLEDSGASEDELADFNSELSGVRQSDTWVYIYNHEMTGDVIVNKEDYEQGLAKINAYAQKRGRSENYFEYMDKNNSGTIENADVSWFSEAYATYGDLDWDHAFKRNLKVLAGGVFPYSFNLHDTNLDLNGQTISVADCMSFTTDMPQFWSGNGATLDINGGKLLIQNNLVFRTASPDGWGGNTGQLMNLNGGEVYIGNCFDFGQANCYDTILMTNDADRLYVGGNWTYITLQDMEGKWTAGQIRFAGPTWEVNEHSGEKAIYSSGTQSIIFGYDGGKQTILWDNPETYIDNEDGSYNTDRRLNFDYEYGILVTKEFTKENFWFRPWWRPYDEPDYTLYRKGWEIGDGVHIATGNYSKSFTDLSIASPGVKSDFVRTYNSMSNEEGSFGIGWDFNIDVSKIVIPAQGYYQVVLPDGSNTTFKDNGNGGFECLNAHSEMTKSGNTYTITNAAQSQYHFNSDGELDWVKDANGNKLTISSKSNDQRIVTDSTGRTYKIYYNGNSEHSRITKIEDTSAGRIVTYEYNGDFQLVSATSVSGGTEKYEYDGKGRLCKITNCYNEMTDQIVYNDNGSVNWLTNSAGLKQEYTYDKAFKQTGLNEYDGDKLVKTFTYDYDEKYAVKTNKVETDGHTYDVDKITYNMIDDENKYDEMSESVDIMGNTTKYERDENGNVIKQINPDGTFTLARYNDKNMPLVQVDERNNVVISEYDESGVNVVKKYQSLHTVSNAADLVKSSFNLSSLDYTDYAMVVYTYYPASETAEIAGLIRTITDAEGHITEYTYGTSGNAKGLPIKKVIKDGNTVVNSVEYEYNSQLQVSKEKTSVDISGNIYAVKEYEYDKFNNVTKVKDFGTGSTAAVTISEYDKLSRKTAEYTPNFSADKSHGTLTTYYPSGAVKTQTDALGNVTSFTYDAYGKTIEKTNPDGTVNGAEYDGLQREKATYFRVSEDYPKQILTSTEYKFESGKLRTIKTTYITAEKQVVTETLADFRENTVQEKTNGEIKRTSVYYTNGQLKSQTDALGNTTKYEYNYLNKLTKTIAPFDERNAETVNEYDKNGNVIKVIQNIDDGKKSITRNQYNAMGLLEKVTLSDGTLNGGKNITKYFYNNAGIQTKMYTGMSSESDTSYLTTNYEYDSWLRPVRTIDSTGYNSGTITYDLNGNVLTSTDANGNVTTNTYDALNRVLTANTVNPNDSSKNVSKSYQYDKMGRTVRTTVNDKSTTYLYDDLGRVYQEEGYNSFKGYKYAGISQYPIYECSGIFHKIIYYEKDYEYDDEMRVSSVQENENDIVSYTYDANGNKKSETLGNGVISTYTYNKANRITKIENKKGNSNISVYEYSYYLDGSDACKVRNENGIIETTEYEYDGLKRLTEESVKVGKSTDTYAYEYDDYGNRSKMTATGSENYVTEYSYNNAQGKYTALLQKETKTVEDDNALKLQNNVKQTVYTYDANGNQITKTTDGKTETNTYDGLNQLIGFTDGETTASYTYSISGLRDSKTVNGVTTTHIWSGSQIVVDYTAHYTSTVYIRGTSLAAAFDWDEGSKGDNRFYIQNAHGDVVNLTNADGEVTKKYTYDAFGVEKDIVDSDTNAFRYCGEYYDAETGTIYLRARYYNPSTGRFISRDSVTGDINDPLSLNLYTYCHNNPLLNFDPSGNSIRSWLNDRVDDWKTGIDMLKNECWGDGGKYFASYSEGVADTLCGYGDIANKLLDHPIQTTCDSIGQLITDPIKPVKNVGAFYSNLASASYNHDWNSVAYSLGGATTHTAVIGCTYTVASSIPNSINMKIPQISAAALTTGKTVLALSTATARISTAGAVSIGEAVAGVNILYSKGKPSGKNTSKSIRKVDDNYLKQKGFDAHELKKDALGSKANIAQYDIYQDANGDLWVYRKGGKGEGIPLYEKIK
jgi:RHS repeat-associated protein